MKANKGVTLSLYKFEVLTGCYLGTTSVLPFGN